jgi:hypothetical protein
MACVTYRNYPSSRTDTAQEEGWTRSEGMAGQLLVLTDEGFLSSGDFAQKKCISHE